MIMSVKTCVRDNIVRDNYVQGCQVTWKTWKTWKSLENGKNKQLNLEKP